MRASWCQAKHFPSGSHVFLPLSHAGRCCKRPRDTDGDTEETHTQLSPGSRAHWEGAWFRPRRGDVCAPPPAHSDRRTWAIDPSPPRHLSSCPSPPAAGGVPPSASLLLLLLRTLPGAFLCGSITSHAGLFHLTLNSACGSHLRLGSPHPSSPVSPGPPRSVCPN